MRQQMLNDRNILSITLILIGLTTLAFIYYDPVKEAKGEKPFLGSRQFYDRWDSSKLLFKSSPIEGEYGKAFNLYERGCGVAVGDFDNDGWDDIYLVGQSGPNVLLKNRGKFGFSDITKTLRVGLPDRVCSGAWFIDIDNDNDQDLFVTSIRGGNVLFQKDGQEYVDVTARSGLKTIAHSQSACFADFNKDGYLDIYITNCASFTQEKRNGIHFPSRDGIKTLSDLASLPTEPNILFQNNRDGTFTDVTATAGVAGRGWSTDAAAIDYDEDGHQDLLVVNMLGPCQLFRNDGKGKFEDVTISVLGATPFGGSSAAVFDSNGDGHLDIFIADMMSDRWMGHEEDHISETLPLKNDRKKYGSLFGPVTTLDEERIGIEQGLAQKLGFHMANVTFGNSLYLSDGKGGFVESSVASNAETFWPRAAAAGDFNNDGHEDLVISSGIGYPFYYWRNYLLAGNASGRFRDQSFEAGIDPPRRGSMLHSLEEGKLAARSSRGVAIADFDRNGLLDIIVNNFEGEPYLYRNTHSKMRYLRYRLVGRLSNRDGIGARAILFMRNGNRRVVQVSANSGYMSQSSKTIHFGLGRRGSPERVEIHWPSGKTQTIFPPEINRVRTITEPLGEQTS